MKAFDRPGDSTPYSVTELTRIVKSLLEANIGFVWVRGEISNLTLHSSGHMYFSLKDENAQLRCVMFRSAKSKLSFTPESGACVEAKGEITVYERSGQYQLSVHELVTAGVGSLQLALEELKRRLEKEGLFDPSRKRVLPAFPRAVGVVTSPTGAAIRDVVRIIRKRQPGVGIILNPVRVQGGGAAEEIANAIREFNEFGQVDVLIVGRGGGSLEDLWAFNEEVVARAVFESRIPVVSAVGHEKDVTVSDLVADLRAPTPSGAAQMVVRDRSEVSRQVSTLGRSLLVAVQNRLSSLRREMERNAGRYGFRRVMDTVRQRMQRVDELARRVSVSTGKVLPQRRQHLESVAARLRALDPHEVLRRGYAVCRVQATGAVLREASQVRVSERVNVELHRGALICSVQEVADNEEQG
ncbi:MAG: exodeoxyribonuclease VII large subunit [Candidatus Eiseniibacteriota bacterium]|nr:MAG: exodeoxyribonuclease VII large subunit [Candidatus Eisenbacteria bacterium]